MEYAPQIVKYAVKPEASNKMGRNPVIGAMVETLDKSVKRVLDKIDELGIADHTIVIFYADNGDFFGREGLKPFYGAKADLFEGGVREPLLVRWPGVVPAGTICHEMVSSMDFFPTFAQIVGQEIADPTVDGISLLPALQQTGGLRRDTLYWHYPHYHDLGIAPCGSIREGRYKLIEWYEKSVLEGPQAEGALSLFDLERDIGERKNLSTDLPEKAMDLYNKLKAWRKSMGAQEMVPNPNHDPKQADRALST